LAAEDLESYATAGMGESNADIYNLGRFLEAQNGGVAGSDYRRALNELHNGQKVSHWMWYIFPQIAGLGNSEYAKRYAIQDLSEAHAYLAHRILGGRLVESSEAVLNIDNKSARDIFGATDSMKLRSSMTLFEYVAGRDSIFAKVLEKFYGGERDDRTIAILNRNS
jgi:uncharacterized protein (DUF1810 family)